MSTIDNTSAHDNTFDKTPFGAPKKVTMQPRPSSHENIVGQLLAAGNGLVYSDRDTVAEPSDDGIWWETLEVPVTLADGLTRHTLSADYNAEQGWVLSIWLDDDIVQPDDARSMSAAMVRGAALVDYLSEATK